MVGRTSHRPPFEHGLRGPAHVAQLMAYQNNLQKIYKNLSLGVGPQGSS